MKIHYNFFSIKLFQLECIDIIKHDNQSNQRCDWNFSSLCHLLKKYNLKLAFHWNWNAIEFKFYITFTHQSNLHAFILLWMSLKLFFSTGLTFSIGYLTDFLCNVKTGSIKINLNFFIHFFSGRNATLLLLFF